MAWLSKGNYRVLCFYHNSILLHFSYHKTNLTVNIEDMEYIDQQTEGKKKNTHNTIIQVDNYFIFWFISSYFFQAKFCLFILFYTLFKFFFFIIKCNNISCYSFYLKLLIGFTLTYIPSSEHFTIYILPWCWIVVFNFFYHINNSVRNILGIKLFQYFKVFS